MAVKKRRCARCKRVKPRTAYTIRTRRCDACEAEMRPPCKVCGDPVPPPTGQRPRKVCARPECMHERRSRKQKAQMRRKYQGRRTKRCGACRQRRPLTTEHFYVARRDEHGNVVAFDGMCKPCKRADQAERYRTSEKRQADGRKRAAELRARVRERRAVDPEYDEAVRAYFRAASARSRAKEPAQQPQDPSPGGSYLPSKPLAEKIMERVRRDEYELGTNGATAGNVCASLGIDERQLFAWREGEIESVVFDVADRVLVQLGIFDPAEVWPVEDLPGWLLTDAAV